jgi:hypothetical protein
MSGTAKVTILSLSAIFVWIALAMGGQGNNEVRGKIGSSSGRGWVRFTGRIFQVGGPSTGNCSASGPHLYRLNHRLGQVVIGIPAEAAAPPYRSLWLNGGDQLFETLVAEENLFKEVEISGQLRGYRPTMGILDLPTVRVLG